MSGQPNPNLGVDEDFVFRAAASATTPDPYTDVPAILKTYPNWVCWKQPKKDPFNVQTDQHAKADDPSTWTTFEQAVQAADPLNGGDYDGIGFELGGTNLVGIDFDNAVNAESIIDPYVQAILKLLGMPYTEVSPSGKGLHAFVEYAAALPEGGRKLSKNHDGIEIYHGREAGRYFTCTGQQVLGTSKDVPVIADMTLPYLLITKNKDKKFKALWLGDTAGQLGDDSSADFALMCELARLTKNNPALMETYFGASGLGQRDKWRDREDYRERTIKAALKTGSKGDSAPQSESVLVSRKANSITPKEIKWLWQDKIPLGKLTLFSGNPDNGKSIVSVSLAAIASTAQAFPESQFSHEPADVLMLVGEDDLDDTVVPRLMAASADLDRIDFPETIQPSQEPNREIRLDLDIPAIEQALISNPNIRLITVDPISNYLGNVPMSADQDVRSMILMPLKRLAEKYNVAVVIVMHLNKKSDLDAINRVGGAMAFIAVCRVAWLFARNVEDSTEGEDVTVTSDAPDTFSMLCIKNNIAKAYHTGLSYSVHVRGVKIGGKSVSEPYVVWGHAIKGSADDALKTIKQQSHASAAHAGGRPNTKAQEATDWLMDALQDGEPHPNGPLMQEAKDRDNIKADTLKAAYRKMVDAGTAKRSWKVGSAYVWKLIPMHAGNEDAAVPQQSELLDAGGAA